MIARATLVERGLADVVIPKISRRRDGVRSRSLRLFALALVAGVAGVAAAFSAAPARAGDSGCEPWIPTFDGLPGVRGRVRAAVVFDDGSGPALYVGGDSTNSGALASPGVARWDGSAWSRVGSAGLTLALAVFDDGTGARLYAGTTLGLSRWDGTSWSPVPGAPSSKVWALAVHDDGSGPALFAGGEFASAGGVPSAGIARFDGTGWSSLAGGTDLAVYALGVHDEGAGPRLFAGGAFTSAGGVPAGRIARWDGASWSALGSGADDEVHALASFDDGSGSKLWIGGTFTSIGGTASSSSARWNGTSFEALGPAAGTDVRAFAVHDDGGGATIYAGSSSGSSGLLLEWDGAAWAPIGGTFAAPVRALVPFDDGGGADLYLGGDFETAGPVYVARVARWDGTRLSPLCGSVNEPVRALATWDDGSGAALYAGGNFDFAGDLHVGHVARWDGARWTALGEGLDEPGAPDLCDVRAMCVYDDGGGAALFVGGNFATAGGFPAANVARWDGTSWSALAGGVDGPVEALVVHDDGSGPALWVGGDFDLAGGVPAANLARWDGSGWSAPAGGAPDDAVHALAFWDDGGGGDLYVGGLFAQCGSVAASGVARWDGSGWSALGTGVAGGTSPLVVEALAVFDDGGGEDLYAGGSFATAGGVTASRIARWDGTGWSAVGGGTSSGPSNRKVLSLHAFDDGTGPALYVGCFVFTTFDGVLTWQIARWSGTSWSALGSGALSSVYAFADHDDGTGPALFVGSHSVFEDTGDYFLAKWRGCPGGTTFCHGDASLCPCGNGGLPGRGCDNAQGTGGVELALAAQTTSPRAATVIGTGFPTPGSPTAILFGQSALAGPPAVLGDGLRCVASSTLVRLSVSIASGGTSTHAFDQGAMAGGVYSYQVWYRNVPASYCRWQGLNLSSGLRISWP